MIKLDRKLKYMFKEMPHVCYKDENTGNSFRADKLCFASFKGNEIPTEIDDIDEWDLVHLDGNFENCALDNLELIIFEDDPSLKLKSDIKTLKQELISKNEQIKKLTFESKSKDGKVDNMNRQVLYEQKRNKELCKEIKSLEKEVRRLFKIIDSTK